MMQNRNLTFKHYLIIGSMLFGMFFGAGNLIFPIHLGQLAGHQWLTAGLGFLLTGTLLPLLGIIASLLITPALIALGLPLLTVPFVLGCWLVLACLRLFVPSN